MIPDPRNPKAGDRFVITRWDGEETETYTVLSRNRFDTVGDSVTIKFDNGHTTEWYTADVRYDRPIR